MSEGNKAMFFHHSREKGMYRAWLHYGSGGCASVELSWGAPWLCGISFGFDEEHGWGGSIRAVLAGIYLHATLPRRLSLKESREVSLSLFEWHLHWSIWRDPMGGWSCDVPKWRDGGIDIQDILLGESTCNTTTIEERAIVVPMPEKSYPATAKLQEFAWSRPRWFTKRVKRVEIEIPGGIPHAGKGENSWDCGDDATFSITTGQCRSIPEGIGILVGSCLRDRIRYGGWDDFEWKRNKAA